MDPQPNASVSEDIARREPANQVTQNHIVPKQPGYLLLAWILLLLLGAFFLFASVSDLAADGRSGLPSDHLEVFHAIAGVTWASAKLSSPKITQYVTLLEITYAVHELVFGLLFLIIVVIPFRQRARWAWWACFVPMLANLTYTFAIAHYSTTTLVYSLIADVALPVLLLLHVPAFFGKSTRRSVSPRHEREAG
ncbi:MAG TPA: hypothetical protein VKR06_27695 [Ktedonosporobacter sp.]|nr:hypothetical protein [Ktedonosporobacter sp.]